VLRTRLILIVNRATREFGADSFGRDYSRRLMAWIEAHYAPCATFGAQDPRLAVGDRPFFVRAYCRSGADDQRVGGGSAASGIPR